MTSLAMPHPHVLASASYDRTVRLWDARAAAGGEGGYGDGEGGGGDGDDGGDRRRASSSHSASSSPKTDLPPLATLVGHSDYVTCLASLGAVASGAGAGAGAGGAEDGAGSPAPRRLASAGLGGEVLGWDLAALGPPSVLAARGPAPALLGSPASSLPAARASVFSLASDATGDLLAVGGPGGALRLVDARASGRGEGADFRGHSDVVRSLALSPCGRRMLSASSDRTVRLWDVGQRRCVCVLAPHTDSAWAVAPWPGGGGGAASAQRAGVAPPSPRPSAPPPPAPALAPPPSAPASPWGDDLLSAGRDGVVYRTHAPSRAAEAVAVMPPPRSSVSPSSSSSVAAAAPAACSALAADFGRSLVWVAAMGDPSLRAWRVPAARPSAGGSGGGGGGAAAAAAAAVGSSSFAPPAAPAPLPLSVALPLLAGRAFHVPSSPLVRARQALGGGGRGAAGGGGGTAGGGGAAGGEAAAAALPPPLQMQQQLLAPPAGAPPFPPPPVLEVPGAGPPCVEARWLPDRRRFLARDAEGRVELWDAALGSKVRTVLDPLPPPLLSARAESPAAAAAGGGTGRETEAEARMREAERRCWTPAVGAPWARLDAALGAPRLSLLSEERGGGAAACFSSELYALADLGHEGAPDDLKVNSGVELLRAAAAGWVRRLAAAAAAAAEAAAAAAGTAAAAAAEEAEDGGR